MPPLGSPPSWGFPLDRFLKSGGYVPSTCLEDDQGCHKLPGRNNYKHIDTCVYHCTFNNVFPTKYGGFDIAILVYQELFFLAVFTQGFKVSQI